MVTLLVWSSFSDVQRSQLNMHQQRWMEYLNDYEFNLKYHPDKANKVVNSLSRKEIHVIELMMLEYDLMEKLWNLDLRFDWTPGGVFISKLSIKNYLRERIRQPQWSDAELQAN